MSTRARKTTKMQLIEQKDARKRSIEQILLEAYRQYGNMREAGAALGITHAAFSNWVMRLDLELPAKQRRAS